MRITTEELKQILADHALWLSGEVGRRADLSGAILRGADLRGADLRGADLRGADLRDAILRGADLRDAILRGSDLSGASLSGSNLSGASLSGSNLSGAILRGADLRDAILRGASLSGSNLRGVKFEEPIPIVPNLHAAIVDAIDSKGCSLYMRSWHDCETTHCRAGWAVHLAGKAGYELERKYGTNVAGALISIASCPHLDGKVPDFYASDDEAMADIRRLAAMELTEA